MTDAELRDQALAALDDELAALKLTTRGLKGFTPPVSSAWGKALAARLKARGLLAQIPGDIVTPQVPTGVVVEPPRGPLTVHDGGKTQDSYQFIYQPQALAGGDIGGLDLRNYLSYGLGIMSWPTSPNATKWLVHDIKVANVSRSVPRSANGTAEAGLWLAQLTELARIEFGPGNGWMDGWTGGLGQGGHFHDLLFKHPELVAMYYEHVTANLLVENFKMLQGRDGQSNQNNVEWTYDGFGSYGIKWRAFEIYCPANQSAFFLDAGTHSCEIGDPTPGAPMCIATGPGDAITLPNNRVGPENIVHMENMVFLNAGKKVSYHDNAIGAPLTATRALATAARPKLHPHTLRMSTPVSERLEKIHAHATKKGEL
jgi:hypothetical protein